MRDGDGLGTVGDEALQLGQEAHQRRLAAHVQAGQDEAVVELNREVGPNLDHARQRKHDEPGGRTRGQVVT